MNATFTYGTGRNPETGHKVSKIGAGEIGGMCDMAVRAHRYRGVCSNALSIRQDRLESQLLAALEQRILNSRLIDYTLQRFHEELQKRPAEIQR